jgi:N-acetylated-alpha-linked acidic dipeptidase
VASTNPLVIETIRDVLDPNSGRSVLEATLARDPDSLALVDNKLGSGSDYTVFLNFLGLPVVDLSFGGPYGVYHSQYDNAYWMTHFGDPGFRYMTTMAEVWGRMALRLANAPVLPFDFRLYADRVGAFLDELAAVPGAAKHLDLTGAKAAHQAWRVAAEALERVMQQMVVAPPGPEATARRARLNGALRQVEQAWLLADGIPGRPWFRHALYAPKFTYAALELPGVREAVDQGDWPRARVQLGLLTERIGAVAAVVRDAVASRP